jgi:hypothetical protein
MASRSMVYPFSDFILKYLQCPTDNCFVKIIVTIINAIVFLKVVYWDGCKTGEKVSKTFKRTVIYLS